MIYYVNYGWPDERKVINVRLWDTYKVKDRYIHYMNESTYRIWLVNEFNRIYDCKDL